MIYSTTTPPSPPPLPIPTQIIETTNGYTCCKGAKVLTLTLARALTATKWKLSELPSDWSETKWSQRQDWSICTSGLGLAGWDVLNSNLNRGFIFSNCRPAPFVSEMVHLGPFERFSGRDMRFGDLSSC